MKILHRYDYAVTRTMGSLYPRIERDGFTVIKGDVDTPYGSVIVYHQHNVVTGKAAGNMSMIVNGRSHVWVISGPATALSLTRAAGKMARELARA